MKLTRLVVLPLLVTAATVSAQPNSPQAAAPVKTNGSKPTAGADAEQQRLRRTQARSLLIALSSDARTFNDPTLRARSLARIADALWQVDMEQGRLMFRKAWEAAEVADQESDAKLQEDMRQQRAKTGGYVGSLPPNLRREVLRLSARHDRALSEEFLEKLRVQKLEAANAATTANQNPGRLSDALSQRLSVARELLQSGEIERALQFGDAALNVVSMETINFLCDVRAKNALLADTRYARLLTIASGNPQSDANTVSLLSSYIFTPNFYIIFSEGGTSTSSSSSTITPANVAPELRMAFFQTAAGILLRPLPPPGAEQGFAGVEGKYLVIKRLLPFFEQGAPADLVESLRGQLNALNSVVAEGTRKRDDEWLNKGVKPDKPEAEQDQSLLDLIDRAKTSAERDSLLVQMAFTLARRGDLRAREFVSRIDDSELRKNAQAYIDPSLAAYSVKKKLTDQAIELAAKGELTHVQRAWVLTECAKILAKIDREKALELIEAATAEARRIDVSDSYLPRALIAISNAVAVLDPSRVWDATFDAVKAANSAEGFSGEDGGMILKFQSKGQSSVNTNDVPEFNVEGIFRDLALQDYERAVELARGFQGEGPRAVATIAIARAVLEPKKAAVGKN